MKNYIILLSFIIAVITACSNVENTSRTQLFDEDWLFHYGGVVGGEKLDLDDSQWRKLDLPHDWSIEDIPGTDSPFDSTIVNGVSSGFTKGGTGWYRKHFEIDKSQIGKRFYIRFDGAYMNSDVWVNGQYAGNSFYGYSTFGFDITDFVKYGERNLVAVQVKSETVTSRWYSGAGIYRHVWLTATSPLHIDVYGTSVTTPEVSEEKATVSVSSTINNQTPEDATSVIRLKILDASKKVIANNEKEYSVKKGEKANIIQDLTVENPALWSVDSPNLYTLITEVLKDGVVTDCTEETFGIRSIQFDAEHGFRLNGKTVKLKGGCIHHDNGPLGARAYTRAEERKVELLKAAGFNAIRMAHNPPSPAMLDACDRLGMLVIDEAFDVWKYGHFEKDYASRFFELWQTDMERMVLRDRNHPSVIMWSIGNEILKNDTDEMAALAKELGDYVRSIDLTRPITAGVNAITEKKDPYLSHLDVCGYNYCPGRYESDHKLHPQRIMYASESYASEAYDYWEGVKKNSWVIGDFIWTAFDHLGEASIGWRGYPQDMDFYPWYLAYCGDFDICGNYRPQLYYRQTVWQEEPMTHISVTPPVPSFPLNPKKEGWSVWDWPDEIDSWDFEGFEGKSLKVWVYSQCREVELFLDGKSLGKKENTPVTKNKLLWDVPYQKGALLAKGYNDGKEIASSVLKSSGKVEKIKLTADRTIIKADGQDLSYIKVDLLDKDDVLNTVAEDLVTFDVSGEGSLVAVANSNPMSSESFQKTYRKAWRGQCMAIVKAGKHAGNIRVITKVNGLPQAEISIDVK